MIRKLSVLGGLLLVVLGTVSILWAGLNWPPPLWVLRYGLPGSQRPTGRVFHVEGIDFVEISAGYFRMGSDYLAERHENGATTGNILGRVAPGLGLSWGTAPNPSDEMPVHWVRFKRPFAIARTEITKSMYDRFHWLRVAKWPFGARDPVIMSHERASAYCAWLSKKSGLEVRLPTESEWECACRAGTETEYPSGPDASRLGEHAWYGMNGFGEWNEVATKKPNAWGFFDLEGNVWEWCEDRWHDSYRPMRKVKQADGSVTTETVARAPTDGSPWHARDVNVPHWVVRGGDSDDRAEFCRSACRTSWSDSSGPSLTTFGVSVGAGFRPAIRPSDRIHGHR